MCCTVLTVVSTAMLEAKFGQMWQLVACLSRRVMVDNCYGIGGPTTRGVPAQLTPRHSTAIYLPHIRRFRTDKSA